MRRVDLLLEHLRKSTENVGSGIDDSEFLQYLNDAQERLQSQIFQTHPETDIFANEGFLDLVANQEVYSLNTLNDANGFSFSSRIYATNALSQVERSDGDSGNTYYPLKMLSNTERRNGYGYVVRGSDLILTPFPSGAGSNALRVTYFRKLDDLDKRRGNISAAVSGTSITITGHSSEETLNDDWITIVDRDGVVKQYEVRMDGFVNGTGVITTSSTLDADIVASPTDYYVVLGKFSTSHSDLPPTCERYLLAYVEKQIAMRDSSVDISVLEKHLVKMESDIVMLFANNQNDTMHIPIISTEYMIW